MLFSSLTFLFLFLPILIILYYLLPFRWYRNTLLLLASLLFYAWGEPVYVIIMIIMILINYLFALLISMNPKNRLILFCSCLVNFAVLFFFKYFNFFMENLSAFIENVPVLDIVMPIGISFYTFQIVSYLIDVYRGDVQVQKNPLYFGCYVSLFPQLIAGPIVRYIDVEYEMMHRKFNLQGTADGLRRFVIGLGKKVIIANHMAIVSDTIFASTFEGLSFTSAWLGAIAFAFQIYYDFSGYSDMAIGLGKIFGFKFNENFNYPYIAKSITDFWRRWHISLSSWFRDYVYIPLGGNRCSTYRWIFNMFVVWALTGLWHGAAWNFVLWGVYFFLILVIEKLFLQKVLKYLKGIRHVYAIVLILIGWVLFNCSSFEQIMNFLNFMFIKIDSVNVYIFKEIDLAYVVPYFVLALIGIFPFVGKVGKWLNQRWWTGWIVDGFCLAVIVLCVVLLINDTYNPFIYFRF